jgi:two-component sensor histidine kinase
MKNLLSIVQAITAQSLRNARSVEEAQEAVMGRISALGRAQDILTQSDWVDTEIDQVISSILDLHDSRSGRFDVRGDRSVVLSDQQGLGLALALHELATNAIKYGALSNEAGRVTITWRASAGGEFSLDWVEHGGPPVVAPTRTGFGSRLIEKMVAPHFQGNASLHYPPEGARFQLSGRLGNE